MGDSPAPVTSAKGTARATTTPRQQPQPRTPSTGTGTATGTGDGATLTLRVDAAAEAKSKSDRAVHSRVLVGAADAKRMGWKSGDEVMVSVSGSGSGREETEVLATCWVHSAQAKGTALLSAPLLAVFRKAGSIAPPAAAGAGATTPQTASRTTKASPATPSTNANAVAMAHSNSTTTISLRRIRSLGEATAIKLVSDEGESAAPFPFSDAMSRYAAFSLQGCAVGVGTAVSLRVGGSNHVLVVGEVAPSNSKNDGVVVTPHTRVAWVGDSLSSSASEEKEEEEPFAGLDDVAARLRNLIIANLNVETHARLAKLGLAPVRGALVHGPTGAGKSLLAAHVARSLQTDLNAVVVFLKGSELSSGALEDAFAKAPPVHAGGNTIPPSSLIIVLDDIEAGCPSRDARSSSTITTPTSPAANDVVASLLVWMDRARFLQTFVLATTRTPDAVDGALRRPGRFEEEVELAPPNAASRAAMMLAHVSRYPLAPDVTSASIRAIAEKAHGYVGADTAMLAREAAWRALERGSAAVALCDVDAAFAAVPPSAMREVAVEVPHVKWSDVGGMEDVKAVIKEAVELPLKKPHVFERLGIRPPSGVLLYGPPGCSKTMMAKCVATESDMSFIAVKGPELLSKWVGDSEKAVQATFRRARAAAPCVVFFDEVDALAGNRSDASGAGGGGVTARVLSQLLQEMDGVQDRGRVVVLCATNRPDMLDDALLRPGRLDRLVYVPPPDLVARVEIAKIHLRRVPRDFSDEELAAVVGEPTHGFSGAEVAAVCRDACLDAVETNADVVSLEMVRAAIAKVKPQITREMLEFYGAWAARRR